MRVTAGKFKGRVLIENKFEHIRPTADMVKQALFNKLNFLLPGAKVLDLCSGTGALGIEALSRGAEEVVFVDKDKRSVNLINQNLEKLGANAQVFCCSAEQFCSQYKESGFDIILFDPPYKSDLYDRIPKLIFEFGLLKKEGIFAIEHAKTDQFDWPEQFEILDQKQYGIKQVTYLKLA